MPPHFAFSFGIENYFKFTVDIGRPKSSPSWSDQLKNDVDGIERKMAKVRKTPSYVVDCNMSDG